uniref:Uncharacterized protein n=1 Tax=Brassica oleracea TaxID=3712 RepID=A0A3P6FWW9_BRAOL|nr:unnamed protein product [Brassica oleracea]
MNRGETFDDWIREMVHGPEYVVKSYPRFCTRGYAFTTQKRRRSSTTYDAGICSASGDDSVPKKKGRLVGLGRRARSVPPSAPQPYVDPEVLMDQLKDKDDRIAALEQKMADQEAGWEATRKQNEQMMEMMKRMYPNEQFP